MSATGSPRPERWAGEASFLENMSCRPTTAIVHPSDDSSRQLADAFRAELAGDWWTEIRSLRSGLPASFRVPAASRAERRLTGLADAVRDGLRLPSVVAVMGDGVPPRCEVSRDPLVAFGLLVRRSGPIWLAARPPAFEGLARGGAVTLLLPPAALDHLVRRTADPRWRSAVLAQAARLEATS